MLEFTVRLNGQPISIAVHEIVMVRKANDGCLIAGHHFEFEVKEDYYSTVKRIRDACYGDSS